MVRGSLLHAPTRHDGAVVALLASLALAAAATFVLLTTPEWLQLLSAAALPPGLAPL